MKTSLFLILFLIFNFFIYGQKQITIYKTYEDFTNGIGETKVGDYCIASTYELFGPRIIRLKNKKKSASKGEKILSLDCNKIWGFKYNDALFRTTAKKEPGFILRVVSIGKLVYYELGIPHIALMCGNK
jgi:hypothetical protein